MRLPRVLLLVVVTASSAVAASAQAPARSPSEWLGGGGLLIGVPLGDFADATDEGFGVAGNVVFSTRGRPVRPPLPDRRARLRQP